MNFFEHQAAARRTSTRLIILFALAVIGMVLAVDFAAWVAFGGGGAEPGGAGALLAFTTFATLAIILLNLVMIAIAVSVTYGIGVFAKSLWGIAL